MSRSTYLYDPTDSGSLLFLYRSIYGRLILKLLTRKWVSRTVGRYMSGKLSKRKVPGFIEKNGIDMSEYEECTYNSFNDFFTRRILPGKRPISSAPGSFLSPCDSKLSAYRINNDSIFFIKNTPYSVESFLKNDSLAERYKGGLMLVFRLSVDDYHRYSYPCSGIQEETVKIDGILHTVQAIALERYNYYKENSREYTLLHTDEFGDVIMSEVGALMVGKIANHNRDAGFRFEKGTEKGMFEYGGSTVVLIVEKDKLELDGEFFENTEKGLETSVKLGECIGIKA